MEKTLNLDTTQIEKAAKKIVDNIGKVIVGKKEPITLVFAALLCEGHIFIEDVPGIGKTMLAKATASSLDCSFKRIQFTPDLLPTPTLALTTLVLAPLEGMLTMKRPSVILSHQ